MSRENNINIITGQIKKDYPLNSTSRRFSSQAEIKRSKANGDYIQQIPTIRRLGTSSDCKNFVYGYTGENNQPKNTKTLQLQDGNHPKKSLINASKLGFNLVNHSVGSQINQNWQNTHKQSYFGKQIDMGRKNAPNYHKEFEERLEKNATDFHRRRNGCSDICHIQKSYGVEKFFRKYK